MVPRITRLFKETGFCFKAKESDDMESDYYYNNNKFNKLSNNITIKNNKYKCKGLGGQSYENIKNKKT